jgi:ankyrin repeat protein
MNPQETQRPELDDDTLAFARKVFNYARSGEAGELTMLLDHSLPPNLRNERGDTLLMLACYHGHYDAARTLLEHGADPEIHNDAGQTPLAGVAFKGDTAIATLLLEHGAQINNGGPGAKTPLMFAAMFNRIEMVRLLLEKGADPLARDIAGVSILDAAQKTRAVDSVELLSRAVAGR